MAVIIACVLALGVSTGLLLWTSRQRAGRPLAVCGLALLLASGVGVATLWGFGAATNLTLIVIVPALLLALAEAALSVRGADVMKEGLAGPALGEALRLARIDAIRRARKTS